MYAPYGQFGNKYFSQQFFPSPNKKCKTVRWIFKIIFHAFDSRINWKFLNASYSWNLSRFRVVRACLSRRKENFTRPRDILLLFSIPTKYHRKTNEYTGDILEKKNDEFESFLRFVLRKIFSMICDRWPNNFELTFLRVIVSIRMIPWKFGENFENRFETISNYFLRRFVLIGGYMDS